MKNKDFYIERYKAIIAVKIIREYFGQFPEKKTSAKFQKRIKKLKGHRKILREHKQQAGQSQKPISKEQAWESIDFINKTLKLMIPDTKTRDNYVGRKLRREVEKYKLGREKKKKIHVLLRTRTLRILNRIIQEEELADGTVSGAIEWLVQQYD